MRRLIVRVAEQTAEVWEGVILLKTFAVSTAAQGIGCEEGSFCTPSGRLRIRRKIGADLPTGAVFKSRIFTGEIWPSSTCAAKEDLVLSRILWLAGDEPHNANTFERFIYLHGTNQEHLIGTPASHGCIRFRNADIIDVFEMLNEGDLVEVV